MIRHLLAALAFVAFTLAPLAAQDFSALARLDPARSAVAPAGQGLELRLALSRAVPWRVRALTDPPRLAVDFRTVEFGALAPADLGAPPAVTGLRAGAFQGGWSRLVLDLARPYAVAEAGMATDLPAGGAEVRIRLAPATAEEVATRAAALGPALGASGPPAPEPHLLAPPARRGPGDDRLTVVLDPGHGGVDPGAVREGHHEADITLAFARILRDVLRRDGRFRVALTRERDTFVSLEGRIAAARRAGADVFVSIHADAVAEGIARGAQVYTLSEEASSRAGALLAERHNRSDLLAGLDLTAQDDAIAGVLMDLARIETEPRTEALADALVAGLRAGGVQLHARPRESAAFAVLKAPDIPSVLVEIGFMSTPGELEKLLSPEWRELAAQALALGLFDWAEADAARRALSRR